MTSHDADASLFDRLPSLRRLGERYLPRRVPIVIQMAATECGAACVAMVLGYHGRHVRLDELRAHMAAGRDGVTAAMIVRAAAAHGLRGRGVRLDLDDFGYLERGTVLHWNFDHFVVFDRMLRDAVEIVDPALGRRRIAMSEFRQSFTGVALLFEPRDDFEPARSDAFGRMWRYVTQTLGWSSLWLRIATASLMLQLFGLAGPALTGTVVDRVAPREDGNLLLVVAAGLGALVVLHGVATLVRAQLLLHLRTRLEVKMTVGFMDHLVALPFAFFQRRATGDILMRMNSNLTIREILATGLLSTALDGLLVVVYLGLLLVADRGMGLLVVGIALVQLAVLWATRRRQHELMAHQLSAQAVQQGYQVEMLSGMQTLKATGTEARSLEQFTDLFVKALNVTVARDSLAAGVEAVMSALRMGSPLVIVWFGAVKVLHHELSLGAMLTLAGVAAGVLTPLTNLTTTFSQFQLLGSYLERVRDVLDAPVEQDPARAHVTPAVRGEIAVERVSFAYTPGAPPVLRDVSVNIGVGQFVAIVGRSGSGKSTLGTVLLGLYPPTDGRVLFDGVDLRDLDLRALRQQVGVVTQQPYLFGTTLRRNIALVAPDAPLAAIEDAARRARIHDDIAKMPMGYETLISDGGASLSGGQRQRIALARALLRRPRIVLLDEATSALDEATEREVQRELAALKCTMVVIAHRLSTVRAADLILVMEDGALVEQGTHRELLARGGAYARLVGGDAAAPAALVDDEDTLVERRPAWL